MKLLKHITKAFRHPLHCFIIICNIIAGKLYKFKCAYWKLEVQETAKSCGKDIRVNNKCFITPQTTIGNNVALNGLRVLGNGNLVIGNYCHLACECMIITNVHNYKGSMLPFDYTIFNQDVIIEDAVWIGARVTILGGVKIGKGAIVQAGSLVIKDVYPGELVGGVPAHAFSYRDIEVMETSFHNKNFFIIDNKHSYQYIKGKVKSNMLKQLKMNNYERDTLISFCQRWKNKVRQEPLDEELSHYYDHFVSAYIIYNAIYSKICSGQGDRKKAINGIISYLKTNNLVNHFMLRCCSSINTIMQVYDEFTYCDKIEKDSNLKQELLVSNCDQKVHGVLWLIYEVRCNLFHGEKEYYEKQKRLLRPLCDILDILNEILLSSLLPPHDTPIEVSL